MIEIEDEEPAFVDEREGDRDPFGFCHTPGCVEAGEHFYPSECTTADWMAAWLAGERKRARDDRRRRFRDPVMATWRQVERLDRRHGPEHRLTRRAWARYHAAVDRRLARVDHYKSKKPTFSRLELPF